MSREERLLRITELKEIAYRKTHESLARRCAEEYIPNTFPPLKELPFLLIDAPLLGNKPELVAEGYEKWKTPWRGDSWVDEVWGLEMVTMCNWRIKEQSDAWTTRHTTLTKTDIRAIRKVLGKVKDEIAIFWGQWGGDFTRFAMRAADMHLCLPYLYWEGFVVVPDKNFVLQFDIGDNYRNYYLYLAQRKQ